MVKKIVIVGLFILMVLVPASTVRAEDLSTYCSKLNGTWSSNTCTIPAGSSGEVPAADVLGLIAGQMINVYGTLTINGTLNLQGGHLNNFAITHNNGTISNQTLADAQEYGLKNYATFNNNGSLNIVANSKVWNYGAF